jgi:hypothetical protein
MPHVALVNMTDRKIAYSETYPTEAEAIARLRSLGAQAELEIAGLGTGPAGKKWATYGPAEEPFAFPAEAPDA